MRETIATLITAEQISTRIDELAKQVKNDYQDKLVTLVCVLKGGVMFMADLAKKLEMHVEFDFLDISSYGGGTESSGVIKINKDLNDSIEGKDVLLVEDIIDSGRTLSHLITHLKAQKPKSLKVCTLLDKPDRRVVFDAEPDYTGFVIPDEFVVGFGLDYDQKYRNLNYIGVLQLEADE